MAKPEPFNGKEFKRFWRTSTLYILDNASDFRADENKILFVLSFMTKELAELWAQNYVDRAIEQNAGSFGTWDQFTSEIRESFENKNARQEAQVKLETLKQGQQTAEEFFQRFELLRREAGFTSEIHRNYLIGLLERNMEEAVIDTVYMQYPLPVNYEEWKEKIIGLDSLRRRRMANKQASKAAQPRRTPEQRPHQPEQILTALTNEFAPPISGLGPARSGRSKSMDFAKAQRLRVCFRCGQEGHIGKFCPERKNPAPSGETIKLDVRKLERSELEELVNKWKSIHQQVPVKEKTVKSKNNYFSSTASSTALGFNNIIKNDKNPKINIPVLVPDCYVPKVESVSQERSTTRSVFNSLKPEKYLIPQKRKRPSLKHKV